MSKIVWVRVPSPAPKRIDDAAQFARHFIRRIHMRKSLLLAITSASMAACLSSCSAYTSHYSATLMVKSQTSKKSSLSFQSLKGTLVFNMKFGSSDKELSYSGSIEEGTINVYYDNTGTKTELFTVNAGEKVENTLASLQEGNLYIIIETVDTCKTGDFSFTIS